MHRLRTLRHTRQALACALALAFALTCAACAVVEPGEPTSRPSPEPTATAAPETIQETPVPAPESFRLTILHNNDAESQLLHAGRGREDFGGAARFAALVAKLREEARDGGGGVVALSAGDSYLAGPEISASLESPDTPFYDVMALELIGYDAIALGNHEFDFGPEVLADAIGAFSTPVPFLSANLDFSGEPRLAALAADGRIAASVILTVGGERVGVVGATTPGLPYISSPRNVRVDDDVAGRVQQEIDALAAAGVNKIILLSHLHGIAGDLALVAQLRGVDIVVAGGGSELLANEGDLLVPGDEDSRYGPYPLLAESAGGSAVPVVSVPGRYLYVGRLTVEFDANGNVTAIDPASGPVRVAGGAQPDAVASHPEVQERVVAPVAAHVSALARQVVAVTEAPLDGRREAVRTRETNQGNLMADAVLWQARALAADFGAPAPHVAIQNGGGIRNDGMIAAGPVYALDVYGMAPFPNFITIVPDIGAAQFKEILENAVSQAEHRDGRFPQIAGFTFVWDANGTSQALDEDGRVVTPGTRVRSAQLADGTWLVRDGAAVAGAGPVHIATLDFIARGGDEYPYRGAPFVSLGVTYRQAIVNYIGEELGGVITADRYPVGGAGRIRAP